MTSICFSLDVENWNGLNVMRIAILAGMGVLVWSWGIFDLDTITAGLGRSCTAG